MNFSHGITSSQTYAPHKYCGLDNETILFMAQYARLSELDPQWLATISSIPHFCGDIVELRGLSTSFWETNSKLVVEITPESMYHMPFNILSLIEPHCYYRLSPGRRNCYAHGDKAKWIFRSLSNLCPENKTRVG